MFQKLILTIVLIFVAWFGMRYYARLKRRDQTSARRPDRPRDARAAAGDGGGDEVQETEKCSVCGAYVPLGAAKSCGRPGCPYFG